MHNHQNLHRLTYDNETLLITLTSLSFNQHHTHEYFLNGSIVYVPGKIDVCGSFKVDTINNSQLSIQKYLGNPFDCRPTLEYESRRYQITVTSMICDFD